MSKRCVYVKFLIYLTIYNVHAKSRDRLFQNVIVKRKMYLKQKIKPNKDDSGITLIELVLAILIAATLVSIAIPIYTKYKDDRKVNNAVSDIHQLELYLAVFEADNGRFPDTLDELGRGSFTDPWGNPYQYLPVEGTPVGKLRKDRIMTCTAREKTGRVRRLLQRR